MAKRFTAKIIIAATPRLRDAIGKKAKQLDMSAAQYMRAVLAECVGMGVKTK